MGWIANRSGGHFATLYTHIDDLVESLRVTGSCPAVMNAIIDALWRAFRISHLDIPATPERVWNAIEDIGRARAL